MSDTLDRQAARFARRDRETQAAVLEQELQSEGYRPWKSSVEFWDKLPRQRSEDLRRAEDGCRGHGAGRGLAIVGWMILALVLLGVLGMFRVLNATAVTSAAPAMTTGVSR